MTYPEHFTPKKQNIHSSKAHERFSKINVMVGHKTSLNKFKKIEIISSIFSDHDDLKLDTNLKKKTQKHSNTWRFNNDLKEEIKKFQETNENEHTIGEN